MPKIGAHRLPPDETSELVNDIFHRLFNAYGPQHWWPVSPRAQSRQQAKTEIILSAILTQNTSWRNVERAIDALYDHNLMAWEKLRDISQDALAAVIRPAGTFRVKARRVKAFVQHLWDHHAGRTEPWLNGDLRKVRSELLSIPGIGPETADAILLYAGNRPIFVVDAYTRRIFVRHGLLPPDGNYAAAQRLVHDAMPPQPEMYGEFHALLVELGKHHCRARAICQGCPLQELPHDEQAVPGKSAGPGQSKKLKKVAKEDVPR